MLLFIGILIEPPLHSLVDLQMYHFKDNASLLQRLCKSSWRFDRARVIKIKFPRHRVVQMHHTKFG